MYHCEACNKDWWIFERRICIGPCAPYMSMPCPECGTDMPNALYEDWLAFQMQSHPDEYITSWVQG